MAVVAGSEGTPTRSSSAPPTARRHTTWWALGAIVALGVVVRFTTLNQQSLWFDEATTWGIVAHGLGHVLTTVPKTESTPPMYYVLLWLWSRVFGLSEPGLRSFSALCSTLTIPVVWIIGRRLFSHRVGLVAALLAAVNPLLFWYAQEARAYSLLLLLSAVSLLAFTHALESPTRRRLLIWSVASALALAAHYYAAVLIGSEAVWLAATLHRRGLLTADRAASALAPLVAVGAALIPLAIRQNDGRAGYISTQEGSLPYRVVQLVKEDIIGQGQPMKVLLTVVGCGLVLVALGLLVNQPRRSGRSAGLMLLGVGTGGVLIALVIAVVAIDYFNTRNLMPTWPALLLAVAAGLGCTRARRTATVAAAGLVILSLFCVWNIVSDPLFQRPDWRGAAQVLGPSAGARAIVSDLNSQVPLDPYLRSLRSYPAGAQSVREVDVIWVQRVHQWGSLGPITPLPLAGFRLAAVVRTSSYVVLRYRASTAQPESSAALDRLYPLAASALSLLQSA